MSIAQPKEPSVFIFPFLCRGKETEQEKEEGGVTVDVFVCILGAGLQIHSRVRSGRELPSLCNSASLISHYWYAMYVPHRTCAVSRVCNYVVLMRFSC